MAGAGRLDVALDDFDVVGGVLGRFGDVFGRFDESGGVDEADALRFCFCFFGGIL